MEKIGDLIINPGGTVSPGSSIGLLTAGNTVWTGAGNYNWELYDAAGAAGIGYDLLVVLGTLDLSTASGFNINLWTLSSTSPQTDGSSINFDPAVSRTWTLVQTTGGVTGFDPAKFNIVTAPANGTAGFANAISAARLRLALSSDNKNLLLNYDAPATMLSFTILQTNLVAGSSSGLITIQRQDSAGNEVILDSHITVNLSSSVGLRAGHGEPHDQCD